MSLDLSKNAAVLGISLMKELFVIGDNYLQKQKKLQNWFYNTNKKKSAKKKKSHRRSNSIKVGFYNSTKPYTIKKNNESNYFNSNKKKIKTQKIKNKLNKSL